MCLRLIGGQQQLGEYRGGLLGSGLAAVDDMLYLRAGIPQEMGEVPHVLAALFAQRPIGVNVIGDELCRVGSDRCASFLL
jgi:hypothetical protein